MVVGLSPRKGSHWRLGQSVSPCFLFAHTWDIPSLHRFLASNTKCSIHLILLQTCSNYVFTHLSCVIVVFPLNGEKPQRLVLLEATSMAPGRLAKWPKRVWHATVTGETFGGAIWVMCRFCSNWVFNRLVGGLAGEFDILHIRFF